MAQTVAKRRKVRQSTPNATILKKNTPKVLTAKLETAAVLVSEDRLTDQQIAASLAVSRRSLARWKTNEAFMQRVAEIAQHLASEALKQVLDGRESALLRRKQGLAQARKCEG